MTFSQYFQKWYATSHREVLELVERVDEQQIGWRGAPQGHSIQLELWHLARWADHLQAHLPVMTTAMPQWLAARPEIWQQERLAAAWGFPEPGALGHDETGMYMADDVAAALPIPEKAILLGYTRRAFMAAELAVEQIPESQYLEQNVENPEEMVFDVLLAHLYHEGRHLGMMEALLGLQGVPGTATR